jgi:quinohemoprotein ethanol dehydrogenase
VADLRYSTRETLDSFGAIVLGGARASDGMPSFKKILSAKDVEAIRAYVIARSQETAKPAPASQRR